MSSSYERPPKKARRCRSPSITSAQAKSKENDVKGRIVPAQCFHDGTILEQLASEHMEMFQSLLGGRAFQSHGNMTGALTWASLCSGSEGAHFVMEALATEFAKKAEPSNKSLQLRQVFACESDKTKQQWIDHVINAPRKSRGEDTICIFEDITHMGGGEAYCYAHKCTCRIPHCNILVVSTSCKDLSNLSSNRSNKPVLAGQQSPGGSADTFRKGLLPFLDACGPDLVFYENSDHLADADPNQSKASANQSKASDGPSQSNLSVFHSDMTSRYYEGQTWILNSLMFGVPQSRRRLSNQGLLIDWCPRL